MNKTVQEIYEDYKYEMYKIGATLAEMPLSEAAEHRDVIETLWARGERLEALIDLYAYLLASRNSRAS